MRPVLFLDFDGVLHPVGCGIDLYFCKVPLLEAWLRQRPQIDVVVSSSWREPHSLDVLREFFAEDLRPRIIGVTPVIRLCDRVQIDGETTPDRHEREAEVFRWLQDSGEARRTWVALDDQAWLYRPSCPSLVLCDPTTGLTEVELGRLDGALNLASA